MRRHSPSTLQLALVLSTALSGCPAAPEPALDGGDGGTGADAGPTVPDAPPGDVAICLCASHADCDDGLYCNGAEVCEACACRLASAGPCDGAVSCDEARARCSPCPAGSDLDGDEACAPDDCDDTNPAVHPGAAEVCDGVDDDCDDVVGDGVSGTFYLDADGDRFGSPESAITACAMPSGYVSYGTDCDDTNASVHPGAAEVCDPGLVDENCAGGANEGCACAGGASRPCSLPGACSAGVETCLGGSWSACSIGPVAESCNGLDDNCDGSIDEALRVTCYADADGDTYAPAGAASTMLCPVAGRSLVGGCPVSYTNRPPTAGATDCDDFAPAVHPGSGC